MWVENFYKDRDDPEFTKPVHDVTGLLERVNKFGDAGDASERLQDATLTYLIAQHGISVMGSGFRLGEDFPSGKRFEDIGWTLNRCEDDDYEPFTLSPHERAELEEEAITLAKEVLTSVYADLCSPEVLAWAAVQQQSLKWPENDDFQNNGPKHGIKM